MRLIEADALKSEMITDLANAMRMQEMHKGDMAVRVLNKIDEAPTIDAAPIVHAQWRYKVAYAAHVHVTNIIYCTACGRGFHRIEGTDFNYCPSCGAHMDGDP